MLEACDYPADRLDILVFSDEPRASHSSKEGTAPSVRTLPLSETPSGPFPVPLERVLSTAEGEVLLNMPADGEVSSEWIRSMVRRCTAQTPVVVGPTVIEHEDLFLPRLQALSHLGRLALTAGLSHVGIPSPVEASNRAARVDPSPPDSAKDAATGHARGVLPPAVNPEADAVVARPPVSSFEALLRRLAQGFRRTLHSSSWLVRGQGIGLWLLHSVLLTCSVVAVAVPAWRQPTLLALVALMLTNVVLALPAAKHYGQRGLLRSIVPGELMLVLTVPIAGLCALMSRNSPPGSSATIEGVMSDA
jgi:hypothetical protein